MSKACLPPVHASISDSDRQHPRFNEYQNYRAAMGAQLVSCQPFESWLRGRLETLNGRKGAFQAGPDCLRPVYIPGKWYASYTPPSVDGHSPGRWRAYGPFDTKEQAETKLATKPLGAHK